MNIKIKFITVLVVLFYTSIINGQIYSNVFVEQDGLSINVAYDMEGKLLEGIKLDFLYSIDDGKNYSIVPDAEGDLGANVLPGSGNKINWLLVDKDFVIGKIINFRIITIPHGMVYVDGGDFMRNTIKNNEKSSHAVQLGSFLY